MLRADLVPDARRRQVRAGRRATHRLSCAAQASICCSDSNCRSCSNSIRLPAARLLEPALAEVVAATLDQHGREFVGMDRPDQRDVLLDQLFLQRDGVGRDRRPACCASSRTPPPAAGRQSFCRRPCRLRPAGDGPSAIASRTAPAISSCCGRCSYRSPSRRTTAPSGPSIASRAGDFRLLLRHRTTA